MTGQDGFRTRAARLPEDAEALARVYVASAEHHARLDPHRYRIPDVAAVIESYRDQRHPGLTVVAERDGAVVGSATVRMLPGPSEASMVAPVSTAAIDVAVLPACRGQGIGTRLMYEAEKHARQLGAARIVLDVVATNEAALRFYRERCGYQDFGLLLTKP